MPQGNLSHLGIALLALLGILISQTPTSAQLTQTQSSLDGVVYVEVTKATGETVQGSGIVLGSDGFIMTANHVVDGLNEEKDRLRVSLHDRFSPVPARIYKCIQERDLCLLYIPGDYLRRANIKASFLVACQIPPQLDPIVVAGYPDLKDTGMQAIPGTVTSAGLENGFKVLMRAGINPGFSGGPVFWRGYLVGIIYGAKGQAEGFTPLAQGRALVDEASMACSHVDVEQSASETIREALIAERLTAGVLPASESKELFKKLSVTGQNNVKAQTDLIKTATQQPGSSPKVFIQIATETQGTDAQGVAKALRDKGFAVASGVENVTPARSPAKSELRYFTDQEPSDLFKALQAASGNAFTLKKVSLKKPPQNVVELWYGKGGG